jgi:hypothetical protein
MILSFSIGAFAKELSEEKILQVFSQLEKKHALFLKDEIQNRKDLESFTEDTYEPAIKDMNVQIGRGKCQQCIQPYLKTVALLDGSAYEALSYDLKDIIQAHSKELALGCKKLDSKTLKKVKGQIETAFEYMASEKAKADEINRLKEALKACLK